MTRKGRRKGKTRAVREGPRWQRALESFVAPQPIARLETLRILLPLCILGFMSSRLVHASHWIGDAGFQVPDLGGDWRQPVYLPPLPGCAAWMMACAMIASGLSLAAGFKARWMAGIFALTLVWVALADRLAAFTVSKLGAVLVIALWLSPCGTRHGIDSWLQSRRLPSEPPPRYVSGLVVRFFQLTLIVMYFGSGICKARNDWIDTSHVLWTHLHGSYQTAVAHFLVNLLPAWSWNVLQGLTLVFECLAPVWFALRRTRAFALGWGLAMHGMIGLMFGPVIWFSLLMASLLVACFAPLEWLERTVGQLS